MSIGHLPHDVLDVISYKLTHEELRGVLGSNLATRTRLIQAITSLTMNHLSDRLTYPRLISLEINTWNNRVVLGSLLPSTITSLTVNEAFLLLEDWQSLPLRLRRLHLPIQAITDEDIAHLNRLSELEDLLLESVLSDHNLPPTLTRLVISDRDYDLNVAALPRLQLLHTSKSFNVEELPESITDLGRYVPVDNYETLFDRLPNLTRVSIESNGDQIVVPERITSFEIDSGQLVIPNTLVELRAGSAVIDPRALSQFTRLETLDLPMMEVLAESLPLTIRELRAAGIDSLNLLHLTNLTTLDLTQDTIPVSDEKVYDLALMPHSLRVLLLSPVNATRITGRGNLVEVACWTIDSMTDSLQRITLHREEVSDQVLDELPASLIALHLNSLLDPSRVARLPRGLTSLTCPLHLDRSASSLPSLLRELRITQDSSGIRVDPLTRSTASMLPRSLTSLEADELMVDDDMISPNELIVSTDHLQQLADVLPRSLVSISGFLPEDIQRAIRGS